MSSLSVSPFKQFSIVIVLMITSLISLDIFSWNLIETAGDYIYKIPIIELGMTNNQSSELPPFPSDIHTKPAIIPCYLLHKTHKISEYIIERMKLAKQQMEEWHCKYHILYWIDRPLITPNQTRDIERLQSLFHHDSSDDTLFVVDTINTNTTFPNLLEFMFSRQLDWLTPDTWAWNMADIPEMVWYSHHKERIHQDGESLNHSVWIWMMEYDVGWSGHLGDILMGTFTNYNASSSTANTNTNAAFEYLGFDYNGPKLPKWTHIYKKYNVPQYAEDGIYNCLIQLVRYTPNIMDWMIEEINNGQLIYCECRAVMLCRDENRQCEIGDMRRLFPDHFGWFYSGTSYTKEKWFSSIAYNDTQTNKLFHRLKW